MSRLVFLMSFFAAPVLFAAEAYECSLNYRLDLVKLGEIKPQSLTRLKGSKISVGVGSSNISIFDKQKRAWVFIHKKSNGGYSFQLGFGREIEGEQLGHVSTQRVELDSLPPKILLEVVPTALQVGNNDGEVIADEVNEIVQAECVKR